MRSLAVVEAMVLPKLSAAPAPRAGASSGQLPAAPSALLASSSPS
jgi:hypothetical protein